MDEPPANRAERTGAPDRLPRMTPNDSRPRPLAGVLLLLALVVAACGGSAAPAAPTGSAGADGSAGPAAPPSINEPTPVPGTTGDPGAGPGTGTGGGSVPGNPGAGDGPVPVVPGNPGAGGGGPVPVDPGAGGGAPPDQQPRMVTPAAGLTGVHPVPAVKLEAAASGRDVTARVAWFSGVEPCNALAGITVARDGGTLLLTVTEGSAAGPNTACIEIAMYKAAVVDIGELEPGTYTITAFGDPEPVEVTVGG